MDFLIPAFLFKSIRSKFGSDPANIRRISGGFSGTPLFQFSIAAQTWVARGWPVSQTSHQKIDEWARASAHLRVHQTDLKPWFNSPPIPQPESWGPPRDANRFTIVADERLWTLSYWLSGEPLKAENATMERLQEYVRQLARLHFVLRKSHATKGISQGLNDRCEMLYGIDENCAMIARACSSHPLGSELARFLVTVESKRTHWLDTLSRLACRQVQQHWIIRDLWRENLLVDSQQRWIHTVDVGASRIEWPALDFVRLVGSLCGLLAPEKHMEHWRTLLDIYRQENSTDSFVSAEELKLIHDVSTAISIVFWFHSLNNPSIPCNSHESGSKRMAELLRSLV